MLTGARARAARATLSALAGFAIVLGSAAWPASALPRSPSPAGGLHALLREIRAAWRITEGHGVTIAVLSGSIAKVQGLAGKVTEGPVLTTGDRDLTEGTVLASALAASGPTDGNPFGTIGRAPGAKILSVTVLGHASDGYAIEAQGIRYAVRHGASVIVADDSGTSDNVVLDQAVGYAIAHGVVIVTAGWGTRKDPDALQYPDCLPGVINTGFTVLRGEPPPPRHGYSAANQSVLITAPGNVLATTGPGNAPYLFFNSGAALAWTAGTVALIKSVYPRLAPALVARALAMSAQDRPRGGYNTRVGFGLINPLGALHAAARLARLPQAAPPGAGTVAASARFGRPRPGLITAVHHSAAKLAGYLAAVVIGLCCLAAALLLWRRWRKTAHGPEPLAGPGATTAAASQG